MRAREIMGLGTAIAVAAAVTGCLGLPFPDGTSATSAMPQAAGLSPIGATLDTDKYFPLQRTFKWVYGVTITTPAGTSSAEDTTQITSLTDTGTQTASYTSTRTVGDTLVSQEQGTITKTSSQITLSGSGGTEILSLPFRNGADWTSGTLSAHSYAVESLTVGSKTYKDLIAVAYAKDSEIKAVRWFASGYGIVKQVSRLVQDGETVTVTSELKSAKLSAVTGVLLAPLGLNMTIGATASLVYQVTYDDGSTDKDLLISVASSSVATVANGTVTAVGPGSTILTARSNQDPTKAATLSLSVN